MHEDLKAAERMLANAMDALTRGKSQPWIEMFHANGVLEFPYAPPGYPPKLEGRAAIAEFMNGYFDHVNLKAMTFTASYHCGETLIVEMRGEGTAVTTGKDFTMVYVAVITVKNGRFARYKDYWDPLVGVRAMGGLEALEALGAGAA